MSEKSSNDGPRFYENLFALIHYSKFPAYEIEQLHILKPNDRSNMTYSRELDPDGCFTITLGSELFYQYLRMLHPIVTEPILCAEYVMFEELSKLRQLLHANRITKGTVRYLLDVMNHDIKEATGALELGITSEIRRYTYDAATILQYAIHYSQINEFVTTKEILALYPESLVVQAWANIRNQENNISVLKSFLEEVRSSHESELYLQARLQRM